MITGAQCFQGWGPWAGREDSDDYWGLVLSGLGGHGQRGRRVVITGGLVLSGLGGHGQTGLGNLQQDQHHQCDLEAQGDRWGLGDH